MFRDPGRLLLAVALAAATAALASPAGAAAKLVDDYYNEGIEPHADLGASTYVRHARQLKVEFSGSAADQRVNASLTARCYVRGKVRWSRSGTVSGYSPFSVLVPIERRFDKCRLTAAEARYADPFITGWIRIRVWGSSR